MDEIDFINDKLTGEKSGIPSSLYKYRPFDEYTYDMLNNGYVFLCPAEKLDDPSECNVNSTIQDMYDIATNQVKMHSIEQLLGMLKPYTNDHNYRQVEVLVKRACNAQGNVDGQLLLEYAFAIQDMVPEIDTAPLINYLRNIPDQMNEPNVRQQVEKLFAIAYHAKKDIGICSFSTIADCKQMWDTYANKSAGYCVEYNMSSYQHNDFLFPVVYQDNRENNIITTIVGTIIGNMIYGMSGGQVRADRSQYMRLFLTKDTKWSYQKEWRLLGDAAEKFPAPPIHAIYFGENITEKDRKELTEFCTIHNIATKRISK